MKIVVPVKTNKENPAVSPLFGKAKWFAFIDQDGNIDIRQNQAHGGGEVIRWFLNEGVDVVVFQKMGGTPYKMLSQIPNMTLFHSGYDRIVLSDLIQKLKDNKLQKVDDSNINEIMSKA